MKGRPMAILDYQYKETYLHRIDPRIKLILLVLATVVVFMLDNFYVLAGLFMLVICLWKTARLPLKKILGYMKFLLSMVALLVVMQALFYSSGPDPRVLVHPIFPAGFPLVGGTGHIYLDGILFGLLLGLRLLTLVCLMPIFIMTTTISSTALGLVKLGLNYKYAYMATTALNLIPGLQEEAKTVMDAQKMRGFRVFEEGRFWQKMRAYGSLVVPLVVGAMRRAQLMGVAMEARAFGVYKTRTYRRDLSFRRADGLVFFLSLGLMIFLVYANTILGRSF